MAEIHLNSASYLIEMPTSSSPANRLPNSRLRAEFDMQQSPIAGSNRHGMAAQLQQTGNALLHALREKEKEASQRKSVTVCAQSGKVCQFWGEDPRRA